MTRHVLMSEPIHYRIAYEINPWMHVWNPADPTRAARQWRALHRTLQSLGVRIELVEPGREVPDMPFTANAGIVVGRRFLAANFRYPQRQAETERFVRWFEENGYAVERVHAEHYWEGEGDVLALPKEGLAADGRVFAGYGFRTDGRALDHVEEFLESPMVRLELVDPRFYHLDTCFCPLGGGRALYYPPAFSEAAQGALREAFDDLIEVDEDDALRFACNAVVVDGTVVMNSGCDATVEALERRGLRCAPVPTDEFLKAGGSAKCLVLTLDRFEGAALEARAPGEGAVQG